MIKLHLITGFLGAGKTTFLSRILGEGIPGEKIAVLVNEIGDAGIDGRLLKRRGHRVMELSNGCICCQMSGDLAKTLKDMVDLYKPDRVLIEASGIAEPAKILNIIWSAGDVLTDISVEPTICLVDAAHFFQLMQNLGYYLYCQIQASNLVLLNKMDLTDRRTLNRVEAAVKEMNPKAFLFHTIKGDIDLPALLAERPDQLAAKGAALPHAHDDPFASVSHTDPDGRYDQAALRRFLDRLPDGMLRVKGTVRLPRGGVRVNWVCGRTDLTPDPEPDGTHLLFIGRHITAAPILAGLAKCRKGVTARRTTKAAPRRTAGAARRSS